MSVIEASFSGTVRTIGLLVLIWLVLRWVLRLQQARQRPPGTTTQRGPQRPKGEVRIENIANPKSAGDAAGGTIVDADFEEIT